MNCIQLFIYIKKKIHRPYFFHKKKDFVMSIVWQIEKNNAGRRNDKSTGILFQKKFLTKRKVFFSTWNTAFGFEYSVQYWKYC